MDERCVILNIVAKIGRKFVLLGCIIHICANHTVREEQFLRLRPSYQPGQKPSAAQIWNQADVTKNLGKLGILSGNSYVGGQCEIHPGASCGTIHCGNHRFIYFQQSSNALIRIFHMTIKASVATVSGLHFCQIASSAKGLPFTG
mgnify:CR=1 FL=1